MWNFYLHSSGLVEPIELNGIENLMVDSTITNNNNINSRNDKSCIIDEENEDLLLLKHNPYNTFLYLSDNLLQKIFLGL